MSHETERVGGDSDRRRVFAVTSGQATSDGAGVRLRRYIGSQDLDQLAPFLLLDFFESDNPDDYIAGFPSHPHRGFETVTYLLAGTVRHEDSAGHSGVIESGGIQWMTAGRGIVHSEMPEQEHGRLAGFQRGVNLPGREKMCRPRYHEHPAKDIPVETRVDGTRIRVIAGLTREGTQGRVQGINTDPLYLDAEVPPGQRFSETLPAAHAAFVFVINGPVVIRDTDSRERQISTGQLAVLDQGRTVEVSAGDNVARFLLVAARPLNEPVARYGPFVMNTRQEIEQAINDFNSGHF